MTSPPKGAKKVLLVEITREYVQSTVATRVGGRSGEGLSTSGIAARREFRFGDAGATRGALD